MDGKLESPAFGGGAGIASVISSGTKSSRTSKSSVNPVLSITLRPSTIESTRAKDQMQKRIAGDLLRRVFGGSAKGLVMGAQLRL